MQRSREQIFCGMDEQFLSSVHMFYFSIVLNQITRTWMYGYYYFYALFIALEVSLPIFQKISVHCSNIVNPRSLFHLYILNCNIKWRRILWLEVYSWYTYLKCILCVLFVFGGGGGGGNRGRYRGVHIESASLRLPRVNTNISQLRLHLILYV